MARSPAGVRQATLLIALFILIYIYAHPTFSARRGVFENCPHHSRLGRCVKAGARTKTRHNYTMSYTLRESFLLPAADVQQRAVGEDWSPSSAARRLLLLRFAPAAARSG